MANFKELNEKIKEAYPNLDIEAVKGEGYIWFDGQDGMGKINSIFAHPPGISTGTAFILACAVIDE
jgi:hypothetical protein